jgi:chromosome segregation ATPase
VYRRELRDYSNDFREITVRMAYLRDRISEVQRQTAVLVEAQKKAQLQIDYRTQEKLKLEQDLAKVAAERDVVTKYVEHLTAAVQDAQQRANELFRQNIAMADELAAVQKRLTDEINSRTIEARKGDTTSVRRPVGPVTAQLSDP